MYATARTLAGVPLRPLADGRHVAPPLAGAAVDVDTTLKDKLKHVESQLAEARDERVDAVRKRDEAKRAFANTQGYDTNSPEYRDAQSAVQKVGELDDRIGDLQGLQTATLKLLGHDTSRSSDRHAPGPDSTPDWDTGAVFENELLKSQLEQMASSSMKVGRLALGEVASRDVFKNGAREAMKADVAGTPNMRLGQYAGVSPQLRRRLRILDLIPTGTTDGNSVPYTQEGGAFTAAETAEGALKTEGGVTYTDANAPVQTIAAWLKNRKQVLSDVPALQSIIEGRLRYAVERRLEDQVLAGNGTDPNLRGILNTSGIASVTFTAGALIAEQVLKGVTTVFLADGEASAIAMHPTDWQGALLAKATGSGEYFSSGPFEVTPLQMWGVPLVPSKAIPQGTALVGDFALGAQLFVREGVNVLLSDSDQDDFLRNRVTILAEMRAALAVWQPTAFATVALQ